MTAAFLYSGFEEAERRPGLNDDYETWSDACGGGIGIVETLAEFAFLIEDTLENTPVYAGSDYPGVLAYDVVVPLGSWLYTCGSPPTDAVFLAKLHERLSEWFGVPNPALQPPPPPPELTVTTEGFRPEVDIEDWKDRISRELFTRYRVSIDDIGMRDDQFTEHLYKSPAEFADWWNAQRGTV